MSDEVHLHPDVDAFDKERLVIDGDDRYRQHISHQYTAFYDIYEEKKQVQVTEILPIDDAHKRYGY